MPHPPMWRRYARFWGADIRADVEAELGHHVEALVEQLVREGHDPTAARAEAERRFGDYKRVQAACVEIGRSRERQKRWQQLLGDAWRDVGFAARTCRRDPGFTVAIVLVLGLGLGAAITMTSAINGIFIRPLPFPEPDRIVSVVRYLRTEVPPHHHSAALVAYLRDHAQSFSAMGSVGVSPGINLTSDRGSSYIRNLAVSAGYFQVLGVEPQLGRVFSRDDEVGPPTVVLSHALWVAGFQADPDVVGTDARLGGRTHTVIGVMPANFWSFEEADAWTPFRPDPRGVGQNYTLIGRLSPASSTATADAELQALANSLGADSLDSATLPGMPREPIRLATRPYRNLLATGAGTTVWPLAAAIGLLLLIVCANAGGLQMARMMGRRRELAARFALGAGRRRLFRQLLTESVLLATAGGALGALMALMGVRALTATLPGLAIWNIDIDAPVLLGSVGLALASGVTFGALPGLLAVRSVPANALRDGQSQLFATPPLSWFRRLLVVAQIALCTLLLVAAGGFLRTYLGLSASDLGFDPNNVLTARASLQGAAYRSSDTVSVLYRRTLSELERVPGVEAATVTNNLPVERGLNLAMRTIPDNNIVHGSVDWRYLTGDYLDVLRVPLASGRTFSDSDHRSDAPPVALVNEAFARRFRGSQRVIGTRFQMTAIEIDDQVREIVGVLGDMRTRGVATTRPTVYVPVEQVPDDLLALVHGYFQVSWAARVRPEESSLIQSVERVLRQADPLLSISAFGTMDELVGQALSEARSQMLLLGLFAAASLALAAAGLYGLVRYTVAQRTKEIGIRLALGARNGQVTAEFALKGLLLASLGSLVGVGIAVLVMDVLRSVTSGFEPLDSWVVAAVVLVLGAASVAATVVPARRAGQVDPVVTLRTE